MNHYGTGEILLGMFLVLIVFPLALYIVFRLISYACFLSWFQALRKYGPKFDFNKKSVNTKQGGSTDEN